MLVLKQNYWLSERNKIYIEYNPFIAYQTIAKQWFPVVRNKPGCYTKFYIKTAFQVTKRTFNPLHRFLGIKNERMNEDIKILKQQLVVGALYSPHISVFQQHGYCLIRKPFICFYPSVTSSTWHVARGEVGIGCLPTWCAIGLRKLA